MTAGHQWKSAVLPALHRRNETTCLGGSHVRCDSLALRESVPVGTLKDCSGVVRVSRYHPLGQVQCAGRHPFGGGAVHLAEVDRRKRRGICKTLITQKEVTSVRYRGEGSPVR